MDGEPRELGPVRFAPDLSRLDWPGGETLAFAQQAERRHNDNLLVMRSTYRQPFGSFSGSFPGGPFAQPQATQTTASGCPDVNA